MPKPVAFLLFVAGGLGLLFSMREIIGESRIVGAFVPVPAQITFSDTPGLAAGKAPTYFPTVRYRYSLGGRNYESSRIWRYVGTIYRPEAQKVMQKYPAGATVTAYVDPENPADVVMIRDYSSLPYWPAAVSLIAVSVGCGSLVRFLRPKRRTMQTKIANDFGWRLLLPAKRFTDRLSESTFLLLTIGLPMLVLARHLASRAGWGSALTITYASLSAISFVALAVWAWRAWRLTRRVSELRVMVNSAPMRLDKPFALRVEADIRARIQFSEMRARVVCMKRNLLHHGRRTFLQKQILGERVLPLAGKSALPKGDMLKGTSQTVFKADDWPPSGREGMQSYPYTLWELRIEVVGPTQFTATFPLDVVSYNPVAENSLSVIE